LATDEDIAEILQRNEAGIEDLLRAYEVTESYYFAAAAEAPIEPTPSTVTSASTGSEMRAVR
jgi:hypothetical protein